MVAPLQKHWIESMYQYVPQQLIANFPEATQDFVQVGSLHHQGFFTVIIEPNGKPWRYQIYQCWIEIKFSSNLAFFLRRLLFKQPFPIHAKDQTRNV